MPKADPGEQQTHAKQLTMKTIKVLTAALFTIALLASPVLAETCCEKAKAKGEECKHKCCVEAAKAGKVCEKCNPKTEKKEGEEKK